MTALKRKSSDPPPPNSSGMLNPIRPYLPAATNADRSTMRCSSHFSALGTSSRSMYCRVDSRSASCSASNTVRFTISSPSLGFPYRLAFLRERQWAFLRVLGLQQGHELTVGAPPAVLLACHHAVVGA